MFPFIVVLGILAVILALWLRRPQIKCPDCDSRKVTKINQTVEDVRPYDLISGEGGGKMLMMDIKETFRCRQCERVWTETRIEA